MKKAKIVAGLVAFAGPLAIYIASLEPTVGFDDAAEFQTVLYVLGIAHTPGYPLFTIVGWVFTHLFPFGEVAWRVTLLCAIAVATACFLLYRTIDDISDSPWVASSVALLFAFGGVVWPRATITDAHVFGVAFDALFMWAIMHWYRSRRPRDFYIAALAAGLAVATQLTVVFLVPGAVVLALMRLRSLSFKTVAIAIVLAAIGPALYLYLPLRSAAVTKAHLDPTSALGIPYGQAIWDNGHPAIWNNFVSVITASHFLGTNAFAALFNLSSYPHYAIEYFKILQTQYSWIVLLLALGGLVVVMRRDLILGAALLLCAWLPVPFPFGLWAPGDPPRYFLLPLWIVAVLAGSAAASLASFMHKKSPLIPVALLVPVGILVLAGFEVRQNNALFAQRNDRTAATYVDSILARTPPNAIIVTWWVYSCPLNYAENVEHRVGERTIVNGLAEEYSQYYDGWSSQRPLYLVGVSNLKLKKQRIVLVDRQYAVYRVEPPKAAPKPLGNRNGIDRHPAR